MAEVFRPTHPHASAKASLRVAEAPLVAVPRERGPLAAPVAFPSASVGVIDQHAIAATGALILTKHLLHPKSDPKSEGGKFKYD